MGVIRPPWISKEWFSKCPFNYCDHFGDKQLLATICKICKDDLKRDEFYKKSGKDPYDWKNVFEDLADSLAQVHKMIEKDAKRLGIDLNNLPDEEDEAPPHESYPIFNLVGKYGDQVERIINGFKEVPTDTDIQLTMKAVDALSHSRHYILAKVGRALSSRWEEQKDPSDDLDDSKTSAFLAYIAIERNSRALITLSRHKSLRLSKEKFLRFAKVSLGMCEMIREEFFPQERLTYEDFGCEEYDKIFDLPNISKKL